MKQLEDIQFEMAVRVRENTKKIYDKLQFKNRGAMFKSIDKQ